MERSHSRLSRDTLAGVEGRGGLDNPGTVDGQQPIHAREFLANDSLQSACHGRVHLQHSYSASGSER